MAKFPTFQSGLESIRRSFLLKRILLIGFVGTFVISTLFAASLAFQAYRNTKSRTLAEVDTLARTLEPQLSLALWNVDHDSVMKALQVILKNPHVAQVQLKGSDFPVDLKTSGLRADLSTQSYPLIHEGPRGRSSLGTLEISISKQDAFQNLASQILSAALFNFVQFSVLALLLIGLFNREVTVPLLKIERLTESFNREFVTPTDEGPKPETLTGSELTRLGGNIGTLQRNYRHSIKMRDDFLLVASHELRTPITPLRLQLDLLHRLVAKKAEGPYDLIERSLATSRHQVTRICVLVDHLLDASRVASGRLPLVKERVNLTELVLGALRQFEPLAEHEAIRLKAGPMEPIVGNWDPFRIQQVLDNLLSNALKYGNQKPVEVSITREGRTAIIAVTDQGIGIAEDDQKRIFERFERAASAKNFGGLGIGLFIANEIVREHGGTLQVRSRLGEGSTFEARLPT